MIEFQIYDFIEDHETIDTESDTEESNEIPELPKYIIHVFGRTADDKSVYCKVRNFNPYFYIKLPTKWKQDTIKTKIKLLESWLLSSNNKKVWKKFRQGLIKVDHVVKMDAIGFTNYKKFNFAVLMFENTFAMKKFRYMLEQNKINVPGVTSGDYQFKAYEANLPPLLRWSHLRKISGCSWVKSTNYQTIDDDSKESYCDIEIVVDSKGLEPITKEFNAPIRIASFDIECNSIDGQFPQARRKGDAVIQIGTTYTHLGESMPYRQHIV